MTAITLYVVYHFEDILHFFKFLGLYRNVPSVWKILPACLHSKLLLACVEKDMNSSLMGLCFLT